MLALFAASLAAFALSACGNSAEHTQSPEAPDNIISQSEADKYPGDSVQHAFLEYWSDLQFQSWAEVASYYDPAFRHSVGTVSIIGAKKVNGSSYPQLKPAISRVRSGKGLTTVNYGLQFIDGSKELASVTWRRVGGNWQIVYDSRMDAELNQYAENRVEIDQNGALPTELDDISPDAKRAGAAASEAQARFLQQEFDLRSP